MTTTIDLTDALAIRARRVAADEGMTVCSVIEETFDQVAPWLSSPGCSLLGESSGHLTICARCRSAAGSARE